MTTRKELRWQIARRMGDIALGTAQAGSTESTLLDTNRLEPDDDLRGMCFYIHDGENEGLDPRVVTANVQSTATATLLPAYPTPIAGDEYEMHSIHVDDYNSAIDEALDEVIDVALIHAQATTTLSAQEVSVTSTWETVYLVEIDLGYGYEKVNHQVWRSLGSGQKKIIFDYSFYNAYKDKSLRLSGLKRPTLLTTDETVIDLPRPNFLLYKALVLLLGSNPKHFDAQEQARLGREWEARAEAERKRLGVIVPPNMKKV
jgi:hypothetical protein